MKKLLAVILIGAVSATCVFGFTACQDISIEVPEMQKIPDGQEVTEEEWEAAFTATINATNYTMLKTTETVSEKKYNGAEYKDSVNGASDIYVAGAAVYNKERTVTKSAGEKESQVYLSTETYIEVEYETTVNLLVAKFTETKYIQGAPKGYKERKSVWDAVKKKYSNGNDAKEELQLYTRNEELNVGYYLSRGSEEKQKLADLYSAFTYSDGKYTADLYSRDTDNKRMIGVKVEVSINDGYISGFRYTCIDEWWVNGVSIDDKDSAAYVLKDYGSTTVTVPDGARNAVNRYK